MGVFSFECIGQVNFAIPLPKILLMKGFDLLNMQLEGK